MQRPPRASGSTARVLTLWELASEIAIPWEEGAYTGIGQLGRDTEATPLDVPLHPGAEQWYKQHQGTALDP